MVARPHTPARAGRSNGGTIAADAVAASPFWHRPREWPPGVAPGVVGASRVSGVAALVYVFARFAEPAIVLAAEIGCVLDHRVFVFVVVGGGSVGVFARLDFGEFFFATSVSASDSGSAWAWASSGTGLTGAATTAGLASSGTARARRGFSAASGRNSAPQLGHEIGLRLKS